MADLSVNIDVSTARVSCPDVPVDLSLDGRACVYFPEPGIFLHGTPSDMREFARQIVAKVGA